MLEAAGMTNDEAEDECLAGTTEDKECAGGPFVCGVSGGGSIGATRELL